MGFIKCQINGKEKIIRTLEISNLVPGHWSEVEEIAYNGITENCTKTQDYRIGGRNKVYAGTDTQNIGSGFSEASYGRYFESGTFPNLTYNDLSNTNFKFNIYNSTNLIELIEDYNIGSSTRVMLDNNNYFDINVVESGLSSDIIGFNISGASNGANMASTDYLSCVSTKDITSWSHKYYNPVISLLEIILYVE